MSSAAGGIADLRPLERAREQKAWYWYDWANSAYTTTIGTVFFGPYFISLAENAVGGEDGRFEVAGLSLPPDSLFFWLITVSTILSAVILPPLGAYADRVANKKRLLATLAWTGSFFAALIFFATGDNWLLAAIGIVFGNVLLRRGRRRERLDPPADLRRGRARPCLLPRLGVRLPRRRSPAGPQPRGLPRARRPGAQRGAGRPAVHALGRRVVGRVHADPLPPAQGPPAGRRRARRGQRPAPELRPAGGHAPGPAQLPDGADLPGGLPLLQRRHPDRDRLGLGLRVRGARPLPDDPHRHDPAWCSSWPSGAR